MATPATIEDTSSALRIIGIRLLIACIVMLLLLGMLLARYYTLQITEYQNYLTESDRNRVQLQPLPPRRGLIRDRNGVLLAENRPSFVLSLVLERVPDLDETLARLRGLLAVTKGDVAKFQRRAARRRPYDAVPLSYNLTEEERAQIAVNRFRLPGVVVVPQLARHYEHSRLFSHALGYVGRIAEQDLAALNEDDYHGTNYIGRIGLEKHYENLLHGRVGYQHVESNALGRVLRVLERTPPEPGADLTLALDFHVQRVAYQSLDGRRGAVVALDPFSGDVLALVSTPGFDSNMFVGGVSARDYSALRDSPDRPLFNRAVQGQYPPGSTVKPVFGLAGLTYGVVDVNTAIVDPGWYTLPGEERRFRDWTLRVRGSGHGNQVMLHQAIEESCDVYFYDLAFHLGIDRLHDFATPFGFGTLTGVDTTHEHSGIMPSRQWKRGAHGQEWFPGETLNVGIGQGQMLATPLQLASVAAVLASSGLRFRPRMLLEVNGQPVERDAPRLVQASEDDWAAVRQAMRAVFHGPRGTARGSARDVDYSMAGKSGTAQVVGIAQDEEYDKEKVAEWHRDHGLFIAFAPYERPAIAVAVVVENGGGGSEVAAPIARQVMDAYLLAGGRRSWP